MSSRRNPTGSWGFRRSPRYKPSTAPPADSLSTGWTPTSVSTRTPGSWKGAPAEALAQLARETEAEEIVVGSRGTGRFAAALGSVSHALLAHADRPVVVVPQGAADNPRDAREHGRS